MSFRVAEGFVEVTMDRTKYDADLQRLKGQKLNVSVLAKLQDADAKQRLKQLTRNQNLKIKAAIDDAVAKQRLTQVGKAISVKLSVAVDDKAAKARLAALTKPVTIKAVVGVDDQAARAKLRALTQIVKTITVKVEFDRATAQEAAASLGSKLKVKIVPEMGDTGTYITQLERLTRDQKITITPVMGNPSTYLAQLERLTRDQFITVNPRIKADAYLTQLDRLTRDRQIDVRTNLVTGDTRARLDALTRNRRVRVDVDSGGLSGLARTLGQTGSAASGASGGIGSLVSGMGLLTGAAATSLPTLASLGQAIIAMAPAAAVAAPALGSLLSAFAAVKIGTGGLGAAFKQAFAPAVSGGGAAVDKARQVADAQQALKIAIRDAADSNRRAVEQVAASERDLATAQRQERQAQLDLTKARKEAQQQLEDLNAQLIDGELDHRQALLDVQQTKQDLDKTLKDPRTSQLQRDQAQLAYDQAQQHLAEQTVQQQRLKEQAAEAQRAGVEGNAQVQRAVQGVADAQQDVLDKTQALSETRISADRTAEDSALRITQAQRAVADAMKSAAAGASAMADAMAKLAPAAREFVGAVIALKPAWDSLKLDVQQRLFEGMGDKLTSVAHQVLPDLREGLVGTAGVLNAMGKSFLDAIGNLSKTGVLKQAFSSINEGLKPLTTVPGRLATMFGQLTAAAGPAFQKVTTAFAETVGVFGKKLTDAFTSGRLTETINAALNLVGQFGRLLGDVLGTFGNVMKAAASAGGDALGTLGQVFSELRRVTASPEVQGALKALFETLNKIGAVAGPLVGQALMALGPVVQALAPGVQALTAALGQGLQSVIAGLAPALLSAGQAVSQLLSAVAPLLPVAGQLVGQLGVALTPVLNALSASFQRFAPYIQQVAQILSAILSPILAELPVLLQPLTDLWLTWNTALLPAFGQLLIALQPALMQLSGSFVQIMTALAPVLVQFAQLAATVLPPLVQLLTPLITLVGQLAAIFAGELALRIQQIVVPALRAVTQLLSGDLQGALNSLGEAAVGVLRSFVRLFYDLPSQILSALGDLGSTLWHAGSRLIQGLIDGVSSKLSSLKNYLGGITDMLPDWKGPAERDATILGPAGELLIQGLMGGIDRQVPQLRAQLLGLTTDIGQTKFGIGGGTVAPLTAGTLAPAATPSATVQATSTGRSSVTIQNLTINGSFDFSSEAQRRAAANALVVEIKDALRDYDRGRAR